MATRAEYAARPGRESLSKRLGAKLAAALWTRDGGCCAYCRIALVRGAGAHLDHLTPRSCGGADVASNLVWACRRCNDARQNMTLRQWAAYASTVYALSIDPRAIRAQARRSLAA